MSVKKNWHLPDALLGCIVGYLDITCDVFFPWLQNAWEKASVLEHVPFVDESKNAGVKHLINTQLHKVPFVYESKNAGVKHLINTQLHSLHDQPAIVLENGTKMWYRRGVLHRDRDQPAVEDNVHGVKKWFRNGLLHRNKDRPAIVYSTGKKEWFSQGMRHRDGGRPAVEGAERRTTSMKIVKTREWWVNGERHRG